MVRTPSVHVQYFFIYFSHFRALLTTYPFSVVGTAPDCCPVALLLFSTTIPGFLCIIAPELVKKSVILLFHGWAD